MNNAIASAPGHDTRICSTYGTAINLATPAGLDINFLDMAERLSGLNRFLACNRGPKYSVAQHSVVVMTILQDRLKLKSYNPLDCQILLAALLHDGHEAYLGDIPPPVVRALDLRHRGVSQAVTDLKRALDQAICAKAKLPYHVMESNAGHIAEADAIALATEVRDLGLNPRQFGRLPKCHKKRIKPLPQACAHSEFINQLEHILGRNIRGKMYDGRA